MPHQSATPYSLLLLSILLLQTNGNSPNNLVNQCVTREEVQSIVDELRSEIQASTRAEIQSATRSTRAEIHSATRSTRAEIESASRSTRAEIHSATRSIRAEIQSETRSTRDVIVASENCLLDRISSYPNGTFQNPATSCKDVPQESPSGNYWIISATTGIPKYTYCDMTRRCCNSGQNGWMRVVNFDMTDPTQICPSGFRQVTSSEKRVCGRPGVGCVSTTFPVHGVEYSRVCGRVIGYQDRSTDTFDPYFKNPSRTIDDVYVDGVSLTHGQSPRKHIWTFTNAYSESGLGRYSCPCSRTDTTYTGVVPPFIGQDYFCDSGARGDWTPRIFDNRPLWDGQGYGPRSSCCHFNNPPWFCKQLSQPTSDDIELRLCADQSLSNEDILLQNIDLYVQ